MKLTMETTIEDKHSRKIVMQSPYDDQTIDDVFQDFIRPMLLAWGYQEKSIDRYFDNEE